MDELKQLIYKINDVETLAKAYIPFIQTGGIFIETEDLYNLGDQLNLSLQLPDQNEVVNVPVKVAWISFHNDRNTLDRAGIGVSLMGDQAPALVKRIEKIIQYKA